MLPDSSWILTENYAGLQSQALGLTEAAGLAPELRVLRPIGPWRHIPSRFCEKGINCNPCGGSDWCNH